MQEARELINYGRGYHFHSLQANHKFTLKKIALQQLYYRKGNKDTVSFFVYRRLPRCQNINHMVAEATKASFCANAGKPYKCRWPTHLHTPLLVLPSKGKWHPFNCLLCYYLWLNETNLLHYDLSSIFSTCDDYRSPFSPLAGSTSKQFEDISTTTNTLVYERGKKVQKTSTAYGILVSFTLTREQKWTICLCWHPLLII